MSNLSKGQNERRVCVITGGGSGMGLASAKIIGKDHYIIIAGRTVKKLDGAIDELHKAGIEAEAVACDISNAESVKKLAEKSASIGKVTSVIHAAGLSPHMGDAKTIMEVNALGTIHVNEAFYEVMGSGSCVIDVSSMSGYLLPNVVLPKGNYPLSRTDKDLFMKKMMRRVNLFPQKLRSGVAYGISKHFVIWYARTDAVKFGAKGIRVLSVSPGSFETPMGELEKDNIEGYLEKSAFKRVGKVEEIASLLAFCASDKPGYLTGTDILCDGGCVAAKSS